jgi:hypothetical protein
MKHKVDRFFDVALLSRGSVPFTRISVQAMYRIIVVQLAASIAVIIVMERPVGATVLLRAGTHCVCVCVRACARFMQHTCMGAFVAFKQALSFVIPSSRLCGGVSRFCPVALEHSKTSNAIWETPCQSGLHSSC